MYNSSKKGGIFVMFNEIKETILKAGEIFKEGFYSSKEIEFKGKKRLSY